MSRHSEIQRLQKLTFLKPICMITAQHTDSDGTRATANPPRTGRRTHIFIGSSKSQEMIVGYEITAKILLIAYVKSIAPWSVFRQHTRHLLRHHDDTTSVPWCRGACEELHQGPVSAERAARAGPFCFPSQVSSDRTNYCRSYPSGDTCRFRANKRFIR